MFSEQVLWFVVMFEMCIVSRTIVQEHRIVFLTKVPPNTSNGGVILLGPGQSAELLDPMVIGQAYAIRLVSSE